MKKKRIAQLIPLSLCSLFSSVSLADDVDIYIGDGLTTGQINPQVLIVFDNSNSMRNNVGNGKKCGLDQHDDESCNSRLIVAKKVIKELVDSNPNVDWGLMTFNKEEGGSLVVPISSSNSEAMKLKVEEINYPGKVHTPLAETLFEAYRYLYGKKVHTGIYTDDQVFLSKNRKRYKSPLVTRVCGGQTSVIIITDGAPHTDTDYNELIIGELAQEWGNVGKISEYKQGHRGSDKELEPNYLQNIAKVMFDNDLSKLPGRQNVITYTIGFSKGANDAKEILTKTAAFGGGKYYTAFDTSGLTESLNSILASILEVNGSFTSPSISASSSDRTKTLDSVYYSTFLPSNSPRWQGNIKKLVINEYGEIIDANNSNAINSFGQINQSACTYWNNNSCLEPDGSKVDAGGVFQSLFNDNNRTLYTDPILGQGGYSLSDLNVENIKSLVNENNNINWNELFPLNNHDKYMLWLQGVDSFDDDLDLNFNETRLDILGDSLHSKPLPINYGDANKDGVDDVRILVGTNHGYLHMFKDEKDTVKESWAYYLSDMLLNLEELVENKENTGHSVYGVDGSVTAYIYDDNKDGEINDSDGDKVYIYFGLRRGGRAYYALDISNPDLPKLLWKVDDEILPQLGQSWSEPLVTKIPYIDNGKYVTKPVVIVGGGYVYPDDYLSEEDKLKGNAIYVLDIETGSLLHSFSGSDDDNSDINTTGFIGGITHGIASKITPLDSNYDGVTDRLYATDTGGNIWRIDMPSADKSLWSAFKFAELDASNGDNSKNQNKFFSEISVAQTSFERVIQLVDENGNGQFDDNGNPITTSYETSYDAIIIGSGDRTNPTQRDSQDYLFALQDRNIKTQTFSSNYNPNPITISDLYDISHDPFSNDNEKTVLEAQLGLGAKLGWYYQLAIGEKSLSAGTIVSGKAYFTTFAPGDEPAEGMCVAEGASQLYELSLQEGIKFRVFNMGGSIPDTPQVFIPNGGQDITPQIYLAGVGAGDNNDDGNAKGSIETEQYLAPQRIYYHYGEQ